ncbi:MAG TPA: PAS domain S-box protein [Spirochaetota bacterium]|nr:PAS domain S-box protein [Spirochaetota bacterium]
MNRASIMIVEDEAVIALDIRKTLEKRGYDVCSIQDNGESAIKSIEVIAPDLILMDIMLKGPLDGIETTRIINSRFDIPVVYLTSHSDDDTILKMKNTDVYGYVGKPVNENELFITIEIVINKVKLENQLRSSEKKYRDLVENMQEGVWAIDSSEITTFVNPRMAEMLGYEVDELIGKSYYDCIDSNGSREARAMIQKRKDGTREQHKFIYKKKDGSRLHVSVASSPIINKSGYAGTLNCVQDFTDQKKLEDDLRESEKKYRSLIETSPDGVYLIDLEGTILFCNHQAAVMHEYESSDELLEKNIHEIIEPVSGNAAEMLIQGIREKNEQRTEELTLKKKGGRHFLADVHASLISDHSGLPQSILLVSRDITESRRMEQQLQRTQKLESIGVLAGGIAHDFNNILMVIAGNISIAKTELNENERLFNILTGAENATMRARDLTQQLLVFSRGGSPVKKIASVVDILRDSVEFALRGSKVLYELKIQDGLWPAVIDEGQITQVINNLVINAYQAMPDGGVITVSAENIDLDEKSVIPVRPGRYLQISVKDQGTGIMKEHYSSIFDPYFTTKKDGSGLGLAIVYSVVRSHRGYVDLDSVEGTGTTFYVYLPASDEPIEKTQEKNNIPLGGRGRILVMDDVEEILMTVRLMLEYLGYSVECVSDGAEAISMYVGALDSSQPFDLVIMDLTVPGKMGGLEAIQKLREIDPEVRAIVSSGYSNDPVLSDFNRYGFSGVVKKPFRVEDLGAAVKKILH